MTWRGGSASRKVTPDESTGGSMRERESCRKVRHYSSHSTHTRRIRSHSQQQNYYPFARQRNQRINARRSNGVRSWGKPDQKKRIKQLSDLEIRYRRLF